MEEECKTDEDLSEHLEKIQDLITDLKECPRSSFCLLNKIERSGDVDNVLSRLKRPPMGPATCSGGDRLVKHH